jgi:hypothetical protein
MILSPPRDQTRLKTATNGQAELGRNSFPAQFFAASVPIGMERAIDAGQGRVLTR